MSESRVLKCPKCRGEMVSGILSVETGVSYEVNWRLKKRKLERMSLLPDVDVAGT